MSRRISTAPGKAFLWLIAIAVACLMEGLLVSSSSWASSYEPPVSTTVSVEAAEPHAEAGAYRLVRAAATVIRWVGTAH